MTLSICVVAIVVWTERIFSCVAETDTHVKPLEQVKVVVCLKQTGLRR